MAEFQEVARQKHRMCMMYDKHGCEGCPLNNGDCGVLNMRFTDADTVTRVENAVMCWAAEHPEPVYPTWKEWLEEQRVVVHFDSVSEKGTKVKWELTNKSNCRIPADIAENLGIEPKEGV